MLEIRNLRILYDQVVAVDGLDMRVDQGEIVALVGPNGAGKTSTMMAISGIVPPKDGEIVFQGSHLERKASHDIYRHGIVQVPEGRLIFSEMTIRENLLLGSDVQGDSAAVDPILDDVLTLFPVLKERFASRADTLSGGELQMLAIARGLMGRPVLLMLDEPSLGLAPKLVEDVFAKITELNQKGMTILLVEQNVRKALDIADRAYLIEAGRLVETGMASAMLESARVLDTYLGTDTMA